MTKAEGGKPADTELKAGHQGHGRRPQPVRASRLRQHAGLSRLHAALPHRRGFSRPPRPVFLRPPRHADLGGAGKGDPGDRRAGLRRRRAAAVGPCRDLHRAAFGAAAPATTCWSPTASMARPARSATRVLARYGVTTTYYDPLIGAGIAALMQPNTRAVFTEAPGSLTFEMQDIPAIAEAAHTARRAGADGQHLGEPALFQGARKGRRSVDPVRHQIHRRPFRPDARHRLRQQGGAGSGSRTPSTRWASASGPTT